MKRWLNPWREIARLSDLLAGARQHAEKWHTRALGAEELNDMLIADIQAVHAANDALRVERDAAWARLAKHSEAVSRGNRTRALRRRGGLQRASINEREIA